MYRSKGKESGSRQHCEEADAQQLLVFKREWPQALRLPEAIDKNHAKAEQRGSYCAPQLVSGNQSRVTHQASQRTNRIHFQLERGSAFEGENTLQVSADRPDQIGSAQPGYQSARR